MKVITERDFIRKEIADFSRPAGDRWRMGDAWSLDMAEQTALFQKLDPETATYEDMDAIRSIFGAKAFRLTCDECEANVPAVVRFGVAEPDHDNPCWDVCSTCLNNASWSLTVSPDGLEKLTWKDVRRINAEVGTSGLAAPPIVTRTLGEEASK